MLHMLHPTSQFTSLQELPSRAYVPVSCIPNRPAVPINQPQRNTDIAHSQSGPLAFTIQFRSTECNSFGIRECWRRRHAWTRWKPAENDCGTTQL